MPTILLSLPACWLAAMWLFPHRPKSAARPASPPSAPGPWSAEEGRCAALIGVAIGFWMTDFVHHIHPAMVALGVGLAAMLPGIGVLKPKELKEFDKFPVVIKRVAGFGGEFVEKGDTIDEAVAVIKNFWKKGENHFPVIAQEFIDSDSYRVTLIDGRVAQTARKTGAGWKKTGREAMRFSKFKVDKKLSKILDGLKKVTDIAICGFDFAKKNGQWLILEANAEPSFKFFDCDQEKLIEETLKYLKKAS